MANTPLRKFSEGLTDLLLDVKNNAYDTGAPGPPSGYPDRSAIASDIERLFADVYSGSVSEEVTPEDIEASDLVDTFCSALYRRLKDIQTKDRQFIRVVLDTLVAMAEDGGTMEEHSMAMELRTHYHRLRR